MNQFTGTVGNDTFNAYALNAITGADAVTLQSFDVLTGGAGDDTLNIFAKSAGDDAFNTAQTGTISGVETININNAEAADAIFGGDAVDASKFVGATLINQIAKANDVTGLAATTVAAFTKANGSWTVSAATAATSATIKLIDTVPLDYHDNGFTSYDHDILSVNGAALNTVTVLGGVKTEAAGFDAGEGTLINATTSRIQLNVTAGDAQKTLTINADSAVDLDVSGAALKTLDTTGVANGVNLNWISSLTSVTTGAGADNVNLDTTSVKDVAATTAVETVNVTVSTGAGDDYLHQHALGNGLTTITTGAGDDVVDLYVAAAADRAVGTVNVDLGAGDDYVYLENALEEALTNLSSAVVTTSDVKIEGGDGTDTFATYSSTINSATYERLAKNVTGFEVIEFYEGGSSIDASKLAQFNKLVFGWNSDVTKVAATQSIETEADLTAYAAGFVLDSDAVTAGNQTTYAGTLDVTQAADSSGNLVARTGVLNLTVAAEAYEKETNFVEQVGTYLSIASTTIEAGYLQTLTATVQSVSGSGFSAGSEELSTLTVGDNEAAEDVITGLKTVTVSGQGKVVIDANGVAGTTLTTIDLSGMTALLNLNDQGEQVLGDAAEATDYGYKNLSTSTVTGNNAVAETITLGGADDTVTTGSLGSKMDTITGFSLVAGTTAILANAAKSDAIFVLGGVQAVGNDFTKVTISPGNDTLTLALDQVAKGTVDQALFVSGGNTYIYIDADGVDGEATTYNAAADTLIKLTGVYDLTLLAQVVDGTVAPA